MFNNFDFLKLKPFRKPLNISENDIYWQNLFYRPTIKQSFKRLSRNFVSLLENIYTEYDIVDYDKRKMYSI